MIGGRVYGQMRLHLRLESVVGYGLLGELMKRGIQIIYALCIGQGGSQLWFGEP